MARGLFEVGLPIIVVASPAPANLLRATADFPAFCRRLEGGAGVKCSAREAK